MDPDRRHMRPGMSHDHDENRDGQAINAVVSKVKSQGLFDQFRKECLADVDTKPAYHNLIQRVEKFVEHFLKSQKWSSNINKNQLREKLKRQLNNSGMMNNGVERIIEQVVNPKILLGIKPKIDEAVCEHLGINLKVRQEEIQRRKQEQQHLMVHQQHLQHQHLQSLINKNMGKDDDPGGMVPPGQWPPSSMFPGGPLISGAANSDGGPSGQGPTGQPFQMGPMGGMMHPMMQPMMGGWPQGLPGMEGFSQNPMIPGHPLIPAGMPGMTPGLPVFSSSGSPSCGNTATFSSPSAPPTASSSSSGIPDLTRPPPMPNSSGSTQGYPGMPIQSSPGMSSGMISSVSGIRQPPPGSVPPPPGTVPVMTPGTSPQTSMAPPGTPSIPTLISNSLAKLNASQEGLTPEKMAVFNTAAALITKTVNKAQGLPGGMDLLTMFSPRILAEAMMEDSGPLLSKHDIRLQKRKERQKNLERLKAEQDQDEINNPQSSGMNKNGEDREDPLPPKSNLMDVFEEAEDVSEDEEALDMLMDIEERDEDVNARGVLMSDDSDFDDDAPTAQPGKSKSWELTL